jgi:LysM repeat protein
LFQYTIRPGDTLYSIAAQFNVPINAILAANPGLYPYNLIVGQTIMIPTARYPAYPVYPMPYRHYPRPRPMPGAPGTPRTPGAPGTSGTPGMSGTPRPY